MPDDVPSPGTPAADEPTSTCSSCGTTVAGRPLTWSTDTGPDGRGPVLLCDRCTRTHLRSIEARLDEAWW